jgi:F0F1-type ATP synthase membrane subunit c/vacuolar-type H+-ATPase subunit K
MDTNYKVAIALIAGIAIGGVGNHGLNAQAKSKKLRLLRMSENA